MMTFRPRSIMPHFALSGAQGRMALRRATESIRTTSTLSGLPRVSCAALVGALALIALAGCSKQSVAPDENKVIAGETYEEFDQRRDAQDGSNGSFAGQGCTQDCGGHEAGYAWAEERDIADPDQCGGKSW